MKLVFDMYYNLSNDAGKTWSKRLTVPENWAGSKEVPTVFELEDKNGIKRLILFTVELLSKKKVCLL